MKLIIEVPPLFYEFCRDGDGDIEAPLDGDLDFVIHAIANGTPLPKRHGRLIDAEELRLDIIAHKHSIDFCKEHHIDQSIDVGMLNILIADAPTIIEADSAESENK